MGAALQKMSPGEAASSHPSWYHTLELAPGVLTEGWFDLRPIIDRIPIPDVRGKRCLDVGPYDGFFAFELERRGAREVVAVDIGDHTEWDWPYENRRQGPEVLAEIVGVEVGKGFEIAKQALGSAVDRVIMSVYELSPERIGEFDIVVCGSLMLHLRDPIKALEAIRSVTSDAFVSSETISLDLTLRSPGRPASELRGGHDCQWWVPNVAAHREMVRSAGFSIERTTRPYSIRFGKGHEFRDFRSSLRREALLARIFAGGAGVPHAAVLARPIS